MANNDSFPVLVSDHFQSWACKYGVCLPAHAIPFLQLGPIPYNTMGYLARSRKAASQAWRFLCEGLSTCTPVESLPLWHSAMFQKGSHLTYYCPALIRTGILTVGGMYDASGNPIDGHIRKIGSTWKSVYQQGLTWV